MDIFEEKRTLANQCFHYIINICSNLFLINHDMMPFGTPNNRHMGHIAQSLKLQILLPKNIKAKLNIN